jgi:hypothetical protein
MHMVVYRFFSNLATYPHPYVHVPIHNHYLSSAICTAAPVSRVHQRQPYTLTSTFVCLHFHLHPFPTSYRLVGSDLRDIAALDAAVQRAGYIRGVPTLFIAECVLVYMEADEADAVIRWAASLCRPASEGRADGARGVGGGAGKAGGGTNVGGKEGGVGVCQSAIAVYEQIGPNDPFGRVMVDNIQRRGCPLRSLATYPDKASLRRR